MNGRSLLAPAALVLLWIVLWGGPTPGVLLGALPVVALARIASPRVRDERQGSWTIRPFALLHLLVYFHLQLMKASAIVAWEVLTPRNRINEAIVAVPVPDTATVLTSIVANAISLTPGSVTIEVSDDATMLYVHVLHLRDVEQVRKDVAHLEALVIRAFGSEEAQLDLPEAERRSRRSRRERRAP